MPRPDSIPGIFSSIMPVEYSDITVVIQGAYSAEVTPVAVSSAKRFLPGARVILSTWEGSDVPDLGCEVIYSKDPGGTFGNVNRQIVSTMAGLRAADTKYALKMRADFELCGRGFLDVFGRFEKRAESMGLLDRRVVCYGWAYRPHYKNKRLFHPGDFYYFGLRSDIMKIFSIPLYPAPGEETPAGLDLGDGNYSAEQYIWHTFLKTNGVGLGCITDDVHNKGLREMSELSCANNLVLTTYPEFSIRTNKDSLRKNNFGINVTSLGLRGWLELYKKYCDPDVDSTPPSKSFALRMKLFGVWLIILGGGLCQALTPSGPARRRIRQRAAKIAEDLFYAGQPK